MTDASRRPRLLVTGSRQWTDKQAMIEALDVALDKLGPGTILVHGGARGADLMAASIWRDWCQPIEEHPADWGKHGRSAGPIRNRRMVNLGADLCIAFPLGDSRGTWHCAEAAEAAGIPVEIVRGA